MKPSIATRSSRCSRSYQRLKSASSDGSMSIDVNSMPFPASGICKHLFLEDGQDHRIGDWASALCSYISRRLSLETDLDSTARLPIQGHARAVSDPGSRTRLKLPAP